MENIKAIIVQTGTDIEILKYEDTLMDVRSISKTVLTIIAGILKNKYPHDFNENTYIYPYIKNITSIENIDNIKKLKKVQVKHLLTHTIGYEEVLLMRNDIKHKDPDTLLNYLVNKPIIYEPGEYYLYSNAGFYLLSVMMEEFLGYELIDFIKENLFNPLNIKQFRWEKYGKYLAGATRLWLKPIDLLKIGEILLKNDGRIVAKSWINYIKTPTIKTPLVDTPERKFRRFAYAKGLWLAKEENIFFAHGTDGQILLIVPNKNTIILTLSTEPNIHKVENIVENILINL